MRGAANANSHPRGSFLGGLRKLGATIEGTGFTFHSPLAEGWDRVGQLFDWTSTTESNDRRKVGWNQPQRNEVSE